MKRARRLDVFGTLLKSTEKFLAILDTAFEISANEIYNLNAALTAVYFTTVFAR